MRTNGGGAEPTTGKTKCVKWPVRTLLVARLTHHPALPPAQRNVDKQQILVKAVEIQNILNFETCACAQNCSCSSRTPSTQNRSLAQNLLRFGPHNPAPAGISGSTDAGPPSLPDDRGHSPNSHFLSTPHSRNPMQKAFGFNCPAQLTVAPTEMWLSLKTSLAQKCLPLQNAAHWNLPPPLFPCSATKRR
jgi:hypothetical protein